MSISAGSILAQGRFGAGFSIESSLCFTDLMPGLSTDQETKPRLREMLNYGTGLDVEMKFENGLALSSGADISRRRFGFMHEELSSVGEVMLWGHSEYFTLSMPLIASYDVLSDNDPFYELAPFAGISFGADFSSYRNITRRDENFAYSYYFDQDAFEKQSFVSTVHAGIKFKTIINQLGFVYWGLRFSTDLTSLPPFEYQVSYEAEPVEYSQKIRMNYISFSMSYYFTNWEVFMGRFIRRGFI